MIEVRARLCVAWLLLLGCPRSDLCGRGWGSYPAAYRVAPCPINPQMKVKVSWVKQPRGGGGAHLCCLYTVKTEDAEDAV